MTRIVVCSVCSVCLVLASCSGSKAAPPMAPVEPSSVSATPPSERAPAPETAPTLYRANFGEGVAPALVFLHGGPGYNSALFEATTAQRLAVHHEVVVYDRRGTGRSAEQDDAPAFTFAEAFTDLDQVLAGLEKPILLAHSFGGAVALRYLDARPEFEGSVVLVNAPISYPRSLATIIANCRLVYEANDDAKNLEYLDQLGTMDPSSAPYAGFTFAHGLTCGLYRPQAPTEDAKAISKRASTHPAAAFFSDSKRGPFLGFHTNEQYTSLDLSDAVRRHADRVWAVYGEEDRIISTEDRVLLRDLLGPRFFAIPGAAHNVFVDAQPEFLESVAAVISGQPVEEPTQ